MASSSSSLPNAYNHHHHHHPPLEEEDDVDVEGEEEEDWLELGLGLSVVREKNELRSNSGSSSTSRSGSTPIPITRFGLGLGFQNDGLSVGMEGCNEGNGNLSVALPSNYHGCLWNHNYHHMSSSSSSSSWAWPMINNNNIGGFLHRQNNLLLPVPRRHYYSRRPESAGLWFNLRSSASSHNREKGAGDENYDEDDLPQIPKAYVRVKDEEDVTVFMVKTYLVTKLGLSNEAQIEISCMGEKLVHSQSLKYVRDVVWLPRLFESAVKAIGSIENTSTNHYLMLLHYRRS